MGVWFGIESMHGMRDAQNNPREPVFGLFESRLQNFKAKWGWYSGLKVCTRDYGMERKFGSNDRPVKELNWWPCLMKLRLAFCLSFRMRHANEKRLRTKKFMSDKKRDRKQQWEHLLTKAQGDCHSVKKTATNPFLRYWTARHWCSCVRRVHGDALNDSLLRKQLFKKHLSTPCFSFLLSNIKKNLAWKTCRLC